MKKRTGCDISIIHTAPRTAITSGVHPVLNAPTYGVPTGSSGYCSHSPEFNSYEVILDMDQNCLKRSAPPGERLSDGNLFPTDAADGFQWRGKSSCGYYRGKSRPDSH